MGQLAALAERLDRVVEIVRDHARDARVLHLHVGLDALGDQLLAVAAERVALPLGAPVVEVRELAVLVLREAVAVARARVAEVEDGAQRGGDLVHELR